MTDRRYSSRHWQRIRLAVLRRDGYRCRVVDGCQTRATVADHVIPVSAGMPDAMFFGMSNLRAACKDHNVARGWAAKLEAPTRSSVVAKDYSRG